MVLLLWSGLLPLLEQLQQQTDESTSRNMCSTTLMARTAGYSVILIDCY